VPRKAGEYPKELVRTAGISYELAKQHKSELYTDPFLPLLNSKKIDLPRNARAINQICSLERPVQRSGRDQITHATHGHDDTYGIDWLRSTARGLMSVKRPAFAPNQRSTSGSAPNFSSGKRRGKRTRAPQFTRPSHVINRQHRSRRWGFEIRSIARGVSDPSSGLDSRFQCAVLERQRT
jgi:hypothetical protein